MTKFRQLTGLSLAAAMLMVTGAPLSYAQVQQPAVGGVVVPTAQQVIVPAGTMVTIREVGFASATGEAFTAQLVNPVRADGVVAIPAGAMVRGVVTAINPVANTREIQLQTLVTPAGQQVAFESDVTTSLPEAGVAAVREEPLSGRVQAAPPLTGNLTAFYPRVTIGREPISPAAKVVAGTLGGAVFGAATGTLAGLTTAAVVDADDFSLGEGAAQGVAWGSAYGAGFGLLSGLIAAAATPTPVAVTSARTTTVGYQPAGQVYDIVVSEPIAITL